MSKGRAGWDEEYSLLGLVASLLNREMLFQEECICRGIGHMFPFSNYVLLDGTIMVCYCTEHSKLVGLVSFSTGWCLMDTEQVCNATVADCPLPRHIISSKA